MISLIVTLILLCSISVFSLFYPPRSQLCLIVHFPSLSSLGSFSAYDLYVLLCPQDPSSLLLSTHTCSVSLLLFKNKTFVL